MHARRRADQTQEPSKPKKHITALLIKVTIPKATTRILPYVKKAALALFVCTREARKTKNKLSLVKPMTRKAHMAFISLSKQAKQKHLILLHNLFWNGLNQVFREKAIRHITPEGTNSHPQNLVDRAYHKKREYKHEKLTHCWTCHFRVIRKNIHMDI